MRIFNKNYMGLSVYEMWASKFSYLTTYKSTDGYVTFDFSCIKRKA